MSGLPRCDRCGVEYVADYEGPCQERRWVGEWDAGPCGGDVTWRATVALAEAERDRYRKALEPFAAQPVERLPKPFRLFAYGVEVRREWLEAARDALAKP